MKATWKISALDKCVIHSALPVGKVSFWSHFFYYVKVEMGKDIHLQMWNFCHLDMWFFAIWQCVFLPFGYFWCECNMHSSKSCDKVEHAQYFDINGKNISHLQVDIFSNFDISHIRRNDFWFVLLPAWCLEVWPWLMLGLAVMVIEKTWY